jgi:hypothetical protein
MHHVATFNTIILCVVMNGLTGCRVEGKGEARPASQRSSALACCSRLCTEQGCVL